ncbi:MAG: hypothetical protein IPL52_12365 [Flavobacteriales bacterium]|nr:hypothetical protein [Flavobacteriales bacterium]
MRITINRALQIALVSVLLASCAGFAPTAQRSDDVYYLPSEAPPAAQKGIAEAEPAQQPSPAASDDYYDSEQAQQYSGSGSYYDMAYNDPFYYNYGRFGFGSNLMWGYGSGWNIGMSYGWGYGSGPYSGWMGPGFGYGYYPSHLQYPWYSNNPWAWYNDPYYNYGGYGYGYGNNWGPWGNCNCGYMPIVIGGSGNVVVGHRPSMSSNSRAENGVYQTRAMYRDPVRLSSGMNDRQVRVEDRYRARDGERPVPRSRPTPPTAIQQPGNRQPSRSDDRHHAPTQRPSAPERAPNLGGGGNDRSGGDRSAPSRSGGGSRSPGVIRSR